MQNLVKDELKSGLETVTDLDVKTGTASSACPAQF